MTERKPPGIGFQTWVERQIREAMERGENLSYLPATLALRKEAEDALTAALQARSEGQVRRILAEINRKILDGNRKAASGPPLDLMPFDVERVVGDWRRRQKPPPGGPTSAPAP